MVKTATIRFAVGLFFTSVLHATPAFAQWRVTQETPVGSDRRIDVAVIENDSGHTLRLFNDEAQNVRAIFTIRTGFDTIDPGVCPTYRVDQREARRVTFGTDGCRILSRQAEFTLGKILRSLYSLRVIENEGGGANHRWASPPSQSSAINGTLPQFRMRVVRGLPMIIEPVK